MNEQQKNSSLASKLIMKSSDGSVWKIFDSQTEFYTQFTVSADGEIRFKIHKGFFPYTEAIELLLKLEGRRLTMTIPKKEVQYAKILERVNNCVKVPCKGVSFQMYYLNP